MQNYGAQIDAQTAVFEKYGYDMRAAEEKAAADEKKVFEEPSEEAQAAFREILAFEAFTCDAGQPPPAKERQALQLTDPAIRTPFARTVAYEQQVCGA